MTCDVCGRTEIPGVYTAQCLDCGRFTCPGCVELRRFDLIDLGEGRGSIDSEYGCRVCGGTMDTGWMRDPDGAFERREAASARIGTRP